MWFWEIIPAGSPVSPAHSNKHHPSVSCPNSHVEYPCRVPRHGKASGKREMPEEGDKEMVDQQGWPLSFSRCLLDSSPSSLLFSSSHSSLSRNEGS